MTYGSKDEDGGGFYGEIDYEGEDE
jgi:hypothetical protein